MPKTHRQERLDTGTFAPIVGGSGEINTASNVGIDGVGVYDSKNLVDLRFRPIAPGSTKITVTLNGSDIDIDIDITALTAALAGALVHIGTSAPATLAGIWIDTTGGAGAYKFKVWNGSVWQEFREF